MAPLARNSLPVAGQGDLHYKPLSRRFLSSDSRITKASSPPRWHNEAGTCRAGLVIAMFSSRRFVRTAPCLRAPPLGRPHAVELLGALVSLLSSPWSMPLVRVICPAVPITPGPRSKGKLIRCVAHVYFSRLLFELIAHPVLRRSAPHPCRHDPSAGHYKPS